MNDKVLKLNFDDKNTPKIDKNFYISEKSKFEDLVWDFSTDDKIRLNSVDNSKLTIKWLNYDIVPSRILDAIKVVCYFYIKHPQILASRHQTRKGYKPNTIVANCTIFLKFIKSIVLYNSLENIEVSNGLKAHYINDLEDLTIKMIQSQPIISKSYINTIKMMLKALCNPIIQEYTNTKVKWNRIDIEKITFRIENTSPKKEIYSDQPLDDSLFIFLSKNATYDVLSFLRLMNLDSDYDRNADKNMDIKFNSKFPDMYEAYCNIHRKQREYSEKLGHRSVVSDNYKIFKYDFGITVSEFNYQIKKYHRAAIVILCLFTGVRYSELTSFKLNCINPIKDGLWIIRGTITKNEDIREEENRSEWVACPIVRDAVKVLELIQKFSFKSYLVSSTDSFYLNIKDKPYSNSALNDLLNLYKESIDNENKFNHPKHKLSCHRFRHSLARQLIKANLSIPYISDHLKHIHSQIMLTKNYINEVTTGYGYISKELFNNATLIENVKKEIVYDIYHPEAPVAGKNSEEFKKKRTDYFQGMMAEGFTFSEIMEILQLKGVPFADVGLGYCGGKRTIELENGELETPPCIGQLKCNPSRCHNAIIPASKIPHWKNVFVHNKKMLNNPEFSHLKNEHESFMKEAESVLKSLGVNVEEL